MGTQPARGMRDFLPDDVRRREYVVGVVREVYDRYGFEPLETPAVENIDTLVGRYGDEGNKLIFKILKRGEHEATGQADLALRYDLTVPLARVVAEHQARLPKFFKRYQIQPVWRADRPAKGRFREFYQCDVDVVGTTSPIAEAELCSAATDVLQKLGFEQFFIRLNHREILTGLLRWAGIPNAQHSDVLVAIDKLDKIGPDAVIDELESRGVERSKIEKWVREFITPSARVLENEAKFAQLEEILANDSAALAGLANLKGIVALCESNSAGKFLSVDFGLARGLSYYTGAIMEIGVPYLSGSIAGGGRYDNLVGTFLGRDVPACGLSLGLERILVVMDEREMFPASVVVRNADVLVAIWDRELEWQSDALQLATQMRAAGLRVDVYPEPEPRKVSKQFKYASSRGIPFVAIVGPDERAQNEVNVKDLRTSHQQAVPRSTAAEYIQARLTSKID